MAASINWGVLLVGVLMIRALLFGVIAGAPDFWKLFQSYLESHWLRNMGHCLCPTYGLRWGGVAHCFGLSRPLGTEFRPGNFNLKAPCSWIVHTWPFKGLSYPNFGVYVYTVELHEGFYKSGA